jgi:AraC-like DNA-binding protein
MEELSHMVTLDEIYNLASEFYRKLCNEIRKAKITKNTELRDKVIEYISNNYYDNMLSVDSIADYFSVSPSYLSRYMKDHLGYSITDYIHEMRLKKAKLLLKNSEKTIAIIAQEVGYNSLHNFTRVFKRYERITPTDFRNYKPT